jgi:uncharacterized membrane protein YkoI
MKPLSIGAVLILGLTAMLMTGNDFALSNGHEHQWEDDDHAYDRARRAVDRGESLPIVELLERLKTQVSGEVVGVEFEREHGKWVYEFKLIDTSGRLVEVYVDAHTGKVLLMEED